MCIRLTYFPIGYVLALLSLTRFFSFLGALSPRVGVLVSVVVCHILSALVPALLVVALRSC